MCECSGGKPKRVSKEKVVVGLLRQDPFLRCTAVRRVLCGLNEKEHACWDPKDGELCLVRVKGTETCLEARSDTDVQIVRLNWV